MWWQVTVALLILLLSLWMRWRQKKLRIFKHLGIPGPKPNVLFGNLFELYRKGPLKCHKEWMEKYGTICGFFQGMRPVVLIGDVEALKQIQIKEFQSFPDRAKCILLLDDEASEKYDFLPHLRGLQWKETRSIMSPLFTSGKLKQMEPTIMDAISVTMELMDEYAEKKEDFDIHRLWQGLTADVIGRTTLGIEVELQRNENHPLIRSARSITSFLLVQSLGYLFGHSFNEFNSIIRFMHRVAVIILHKMENPVVMLMKNLAEAIRNRRENNQKRPDLLQSLIDAEKTDKTTNVDVNFLTTRDQTFDDCEKAIANGASEEVKKNMAFFSDRQVLMNAYMMYIAGSGTSSSTLAYLSYVLVKYPEVQEMLRNEVKDLIEKEGQLSCTSVQKLSYMDQVISETLRIYPPLILVVTREAVKDTMVKDFLIPKGMAIQVPIYWIHHNPDYWVDPENFDPSRFVKDPHAKTKLTCQAFGAGPRNCMGMRFALMEAKLAIATLLLNYRLEPTDRTEKEITFLVEAIALSPRNGVYVKATQLKE